MGNDLFKNLTTDETIKEGGDSVGGFAVMDSKVYDFTVKLAYVTFSAGKAMCLNTVFVGEDKSEMREQFWMTSGEAKGCKNYYEKDGVRHYLPGFNNANALCLLTAGDPVSEMASEQKTINLYDSSAGKEVPTEVPMLMALIGTKIKAGVIKQIVDKRAKNAGTGQYEPTGETREENEVDKLFRFEDERTVLEIRSEKPDAEFIIKWKNKWEGQVRNRAKGAAGVVAGAPKRESGSQAGTPKLFGATTN